MGSDAGSHLEGLYPITTSILWWGEQLALVQSSLNPSASGR